MEELQTQLSAVNVGDSKILSFANLGLKLNTEEDAKDIIDGIKKFKKLSTLELAGNTLGVEAAKGIGKALEKQPHLQRALWKDLFTGRLKQEIPRALQFLGSGLSLAGAQLVELDLSDNAFGPIGVQGITELLRSQTCYTLKELKLNNNGLGITGGKELAKCLLDCHESSCAAGRPLALKVFVSGRNRLENPGATALAHVFKTLGTLEEISMPQNGINHEGITSLAKAFATNNNLNSINLNDNTFTEIGAKAMAEALPSIKNLKSINFGDCLIRTDGAKAIAAAIQHSHEYLQELNLSFNEIRVEGGLAIASSLENKLHLTKLNIDGNQYGEEGIEKIQSTLEEINKLRSLTSEEFSNDEGDEDDDEDEDEYYNDVDSESESEEEGDCTSPLSRNLVKEKNEEATILNFLNSPDISKTPALDENSKENILDELEGSSAEECVSKFVKVTRLVSKHEEFNKFLPIADAIMKKGCEAAEIGSTMSLTNAILSQFGFIKNEDKSEFITTNMAGPYTMLAHSVNQDYFPDSIKRTLKHFLTSERNKKLMAVGADQLLKALNDQGIM